MKKSKKAIAIITVIAIVAATVFFGSALISSDNSMLGVSSGVPNLSIMSKDYMEYYEKYKFSDAKDEIIINSNNYVGGVEGVDNKDYQTVYELSKNNYIEFKFNVLEDGAYNLNLIFSDIDESSEKYDFSLEIDNTVPFESCEKLTVNSVWVDDGPIRLLTSGDQVNPLQKHKEGFSTALITDRDGINISPYKFMLTKGEHTIKITSSGRPFVVAGMTFSAPEEILPYSEVFDEEYSKYKKYNGKQIVIEGENPLYKTAYALSSKSDQGSADVSPSDPIHALINYIGGSSWTNSGDEIVWEFYAPEDGLYNLGISFKQNFVNNGEVYRWLKIDGKTPFAEAAALAFSYANEWQFTKFKYQNGEDFLFYLTKGKHTLSLSVTLADVAEVFKQLDEIITPLGNLYLDMVMITGETPDANRDYELHKQIPGFVDTLKAIEKDINALVKDIENGLRVNGELSGALKNMARILNKMYTSLYEAHLQIPAYYSAQQTLSSWLYDIKNMSLSVDQIILSAPEKEPDTPQAGFWDSLKFSIKRYLDSYVSDSSSMMSSDDESLPTIKIWVNWGRDQVKVLNTLIQDSFTPQNKVNVLVEQVNATLVQGVISGNSPDLYLHMARTEPVNLAMRDVLYDLKNFKDYEKVLEENFMPGAETPYLYNGGCYALPDTQQFFVMFYRKDILEKLGIEVPKTWDDFLSATGILQRNKMNTYLPYTKLGGAATVNIGAGGLSIFPTMLLQNGGSIYNEAQNKTNLASKESVDAFKFWTEFYTQYSLEPDANFYQKFRVGTIPLGIANYTQYLQFSVAAPEIADKWAIAEIPGVMDENGNINNICSGSGTGCSIMKTSKNKDAAWKFLKWWVSEETQYRYSAELEAILGYSGRSSSANFNAVSRLSWDEDSLQVILSQWKKVTEIAEVPGSYYVSRSIDQAFWATKNGKKSAKEAIIDWSITSDKEIERKIKEYAKQ